MEFRKIISLIKYFQKVKRNRITKLFIEHKYEFLNCVFSIHFGILKLILSLYNTYLYLINGKIFYLVNFVK